MLVEIPPKMSISSFVEFLKVKSNLMIFEKFANLKYKYGNSISGVEDFMLILLKKIRRQLNTI